MSILTSKPTWALAMKTLWAFFLIALPVTNFPFFPSDIGGGTLVRPLAVYPLLALLAFIIVPRLLKYPIPKTILALLPFIFVAAISTALAFLHGIEPLLGVSLPARMFRAFATLGLGFAIYIAVSVYPQTRQDLRFTLRWLYIGLAIALFWGSLQSVYVVQFSQMWYDLLNKVHVYISIRPLFTTRISGLTYEPNWFAEQISLLYFPWLLASVLSKYSVFRLRWRWISVELLLLVWSVVVMQFTYSRAGLFILLLLAFLSVFFLGSRSGRGMRIFGFGWRGLAGRLLAGTAIVAVLVSMIYLAGTRNKFFARIWEYWGTAPNVSFSEQIERYFDYMGFGPRFFYWQAAYNIFETYPLLGVGLGNYAFYFSDYLPDRPIAIMPEVLRMLVPEPDRNLIITPKNFYLRILAETGLFGAATFLAFFVAILGCTLYLWFSSHADSRFWGLASLLGIVAFVLIAFSFDSFAIPNMWVVFGLITAAARLIPPGEDTREEQVAVNASFEGDD